MLLCQIIFEQLFSTPAGTDFDVRNTLFFNILRPNPSLAIFYADFFRRHAANSNLLKDLEVRSEIFFNPDRSTEYHRTSAKRKGQTPVQSTATHARVLTSRSTEFPAARPLCAASLSFNSCRTPASGLIPRDD
jgi:hypothetical protein